MTVPGDRVALDQPLATCGGRDEFERAPRGPRGARRRPARRSSRASAQGGGERARRGATASAASCCRASASTACSIPARRSSSSRRSPATACTTTTRPRAGIVTGIGRVAARDVRDRRQRRDGQGRHVLPADGQEAPARAGDRAQNRLPCVYLVDSGGAFLPLQDEVFPDRDHFGRIFFNQARCPRRGIAQLAAVMGSCTAGGAYVPGDERRDGDRARHGTIFLGGPPLVKAATGEEVTAEELGGGDVHARTRGVADHLADDDEHALAIVREHRRDAAAPTPRRAVGAWPRRSRRHDPRRALRHRAARPAPALRRARGDRAPRRRLALPRVQGALRHDAGLAASRTWTATRSAILANNGILFSESALKGAHFIELCDQRAASRSSSCRTSPASWSGSDYEPGGIAKDGAKLVHRRRLRRVPKLTVIIGGSFGAGNYGMCGRAYGAALPVHVAERAHLGDGRRAGGDGAGDGPSRRAAGLARTSALRRDPRAVRGAGQPVLRHRAPVGRRRDRPARHARRARARARRPAPNAPLADARFGVFRM